MTYTFYVVDESAMPREGEPAATPEGVAMAIAERGGRWSFVKADPRSFNDAFEVLDRFVDGGGFLTQLASRGSPHLALADDFGEWRLGYFEASLTPHLDGAFRLLSDEIDAVLETMDEGAVNVVNVFRSALEDAAGRGFAVAVLHG